MLVIASGIIAALKMPFAGMAPADVVWIAQRLLCTCRQQ